jgi:hypothetical protein
VNLPLLIFMLVLAFGAGYAFGISQDECPRIIEGYKCRGDFCNHSKNEVEKAKAAMERRDPPSSYNFRP